MPQQHNTAGLSMGDYIPSYTISEQLTRLIQQAARTHGLPELLVQAMVRVESSGIPWASRYEPAFYERYVVSRVFRAVAPCSPLTEGYYRATSFGLLQVMGQTAREMGFDQPYLTELCDPVLGLRYGCRYLKNQVDRYDGNLEAAVAAYNAGTARSVNGRWVNEAYVEKVRKAGGFISSGGSK